MAGGGEGGDVTEADSEAQMQQDTPSEAAATSASAPGVEAPASTREVRAHPCIPDAYDGRRHTCARCTA